MSRHKYIGGFFEMALPDGGNAQSILSHWKIDNYNSSGFVNARSALSALLMQLNPSRVLLPAYCCLSLVEACAGHRFEFYPLTEDMAPDVHFLERTARAGDHILAINYFGKAPSHLFQKFVEQRQDLLFIEDCAQALSTNVPQWGHWRLFSPRKLVGVADGGFIIPRNGKQPQIFVRSASIDSVVLRWSAALLRFEDREEEFNSLWHNRNQDNERSMKVEDKKISNLSYGLLSQFDVDRIIRQRKTNYHALYSALSHVSLLKDSEPVYAPFGFPIRVAARIRDKLIEHLIYNHIFPAVHWRDLVAPAFDFEFEHQLSKEILTLPCDQRYGLEEMSYIAMVTQKFLAE